MPWPGLWRRQSGETQAGSEQCHRAEDDDDDASLSASSTKKPLPRHSSSSSRRASFFAAATLNSSLEPISKELKTAQAKSRSTIVSEAIAKSLKPKVRIEISFFSFISKTQPNRPTTTTTTNTEKAKTGTGPLRPHASRQSRQPRHVRPLRPPRPPKRPPRALARAKPVRRGAVRRRDVLGRVPRRRRRGQGALVAEARLLVDRGGGGGDGEDPVPEGRVPGILR